MSEPLKKMEKHILVPGGIISSRDDFAKYTWYKADDVDALLDDPQALAAYLIERKKEAQP